MKIYKELCFFFNNFFYNNRIHILYNFQTFSHMYLWTLGNFLCLCNSLKTLEKLYHVRMYYVRMLCIMT